MSDNTINSDKTVAGGGKDESRIFFVLVYM